MAVEKLRREDAVSPLTAEILLIALTIVIIAVFLAVLLGMLPQSYHPPPEIFKITQVSNVEQGLVQLRNIGTDKISSSDYMAVVYINGVRKNIVIETLSSHEFISTHHNDIKLIKGAGPRGYYWLPGESGWFDIENGIIFHGCILRIDIIRKSDESIYSRSEYKVI
ncbi:MAG: type IV pilin [Methanocorpusculum sp.]|nr:type IV pilin [Methanocorpusculum sp.]